MRGSETVIIVPQVVVDRLRPSGEVADPPRKLEGCHVIPRASTEIGRGFVGIDGFDVYYFGTKPGPARTDHLTVRGEEHTIEGTSRDFIIKGRRKALIITTKRVN